MRVCVFINMDQGTLKGVVKSVIISSIIGNFSLTHSVFVSQDIDQSV